MVSPVDNYATPRNETTQFHFFLNSFRATPEKTREDGSLTKGLLTRPENREKVARDNNTTKVEENTQESGQLTLAQRGAIDYTSPKKEKSAIFKRVILNLS